MGWLTCVANRSSLTSSSEFLSAPSSVFADGGVQVRSLLRSHSQGERSRASLAPGLYHPSPSIFSPSWSDLQGAVDDGAITGLRMRRSSAVRRPTPCHFSSLSSLLVHSSLFFRPTHGQVCRAFAMDYDYIYDPMHRRERGQYDISSRTRRRRLLTPLLLVLLEPRKLNTSHVGSYSIST